VEKKEEQDESTVLVLKHLKVEDKKIHIWLGGDLPCTSGIGASAASCVALSRAINVALSLGMSEDDVNASAYEGEKGYHGTPSGIDNTASTFGGVLSFCRTDGRPKYSNLSLTKTVECVYASTGITASTTKVVGDVKALKESDPALFDGLLASYNAIYDKAIVALEAGDWATLGDLMNQNHTLCQKLTVSCPELDSLVDICRAAGAVGAKMSGTGRGGLMIALTPGKALQDKVAKALEGKAPHVWTASIGKV
jgi:mevalonate kinase